MVRNTENDYSLRKAIFWYFESTDEYYDLKEALNLFDKLLNIAVQNEFLIPTHISFTQNGNRKTETIEESNSIEIASEILINNSLITELTVDGYGYFHKVDTPNEKLDNLISIDFNFKHKLIEIQSRKAIWVPMYFDIKNDLRWNITNFEINESRLQKFLKKIQFLCKFGSSPFFDTLEETNHGYLWHKEYKLIVHPDVLRENYKIDKDDIDVDFDIEKYIQERW